MVATIKEIRVGKRDFLQFPNRYLTQLTVDSVLVVTNRDIEEYRVHKADHIVATNDYKHLCSSGDVVTNSVKYVHDDVIRVPEYEST